MSISPWNPDDVVSRAVNAVIKRDGLPTDGLLGDSANARRYEWLREQIKDDRKRVEAQALFWNYNSRTQFDAAVDAMIAKDKS